jgi:glutamate-ammonia-ligase adenylyltransferase
MANLTKFETLKKDFLDSLPKEKYDLLKKLSDVSSCISDFLFRHPEELHYIFENLDKPLLGKEKLLEEIFIYKDIQDSQKLSEKIAFFKMKHFSRIIAKDIMNKNNLPELTEEYSYLADVCFELAYQKAFEKFQKRYGNPINETDGKLAEGMVLGLGKLGGLDLNYYSDVDVVYLYSDEGKTDGKNQITNREFFINLFREVNNILTKRTFEGQPWIVDLDLRPEGKKGFIAVSLPFAENYYWSVGRTWERHMLIKARHSAGSYKVFQDFYQIIQPFVYRSYVSPEIIDEIVNMKKLIELEAQKRLLSEYDVKRGEGGIREIEFVIQIFQLLKGGKDKELRERRTLKALKKLIEKNVIPEKEGKILEEAYIFLRKLEHFIQLKNCVQTQKFSFKDASEYARKMGFKTTDEFLEKFEFYKNNVKKIFSSLISEKAKPVSPIQIYILTEQDEDLALDRLRKIGFKDPKWALNIFSSIFRNVEFAQLNETWKKLLIDFIPILEKELEEFQDKESFLLNIQKLLINGEMLRIFASALEQNEKLVEFILKITKSSDYITNIMAKDREILDFAFGVEDILLTFEDFEKELEVIKIENPVDKLKKLKKIVEVLATLKYLSRLHEKDGLGRLKELNLVLTNLADFILEKLYQLNGGTNLNIYGLGKLGSKEMNIGSDLDLIFVFSDEETKNENREIPIKITKDLTSITNEGKLYDLDLRLRPYGKSGELAPTLKFYEDYFKKHAKPWERLAWTKSRFITGDKDLKQKFENIINEFLFGKKIDKDFIEESVEMRYKLEGLSKESSNKIDIKLGKGGISDIEFLVQIYFLKNKKRETNILKGLSEFKPELIPDYVFLREIETRLRMVKGTGSSKLEKNSPITGRIAETFGLSSEDLWNKILETKTKIRNKFIKISQEF